MVNIHSKIDSVLYNIVNNENATSIMYYGKLLNTYKDIDKYLKRFDDINDKIFVSQWCNNYQKVNELVKNIKLNNYELDKYSKLLKNNRELNETLNFNILKEKYSFLDNILDMLVIDINIQIQIIKLDNRRLDLFKILYSRLCTYTTNINLFLSKILNKLIYVPTSKNMEYLYYDKLIDDIDINKLSNEDVDILLYIFIYSIKININSSNELKNFKIIFNEYINNKISSKNIDDVKDGILLRRYGLTLKESINIISRYDITGIKENNITNIYKDINNIINTNDIDYLGSIDSDKQDITFKTILTYEALLKDMFTRNINDSLYRINDNNYEVIDGVRVYSPLTNFKLLVTVIDAYKDNFTYRDNYYSYWNSEKIRSHFNCCSLISNENLSLVSGNGVILGFTDMDDNMLLLSGIKDINSTPSSREYNVNYGYLHKFMSSDNLINHTRGDYNELVYERRDLSSSKTKYKKNPSYIIYNECYSDINKEILNNPTSKLLKLKSKEEILLKESIKAAKNFNVPIIRINRENISKIEYNNIVNMLNILISSKDFSLIKKIITRFCNNNVSNSGDYIDIRDRYFSYNKLNIIINKIKDLINKEDNKIILYNELYNIILLEKKKIDYCIDCRNNKQESTLYLDNLLSELNIYRKYANYIKKRSI